MTQADRLRALGLLDGHEVARPVDSVEIEVRAAWCRGFCVGALVVVLAAVICACFWCVAL